MSQEFDTKDNKFVPATEVGRHVGYTKDYILMLIKKGEIEGKKIGNKWYASISSAEAYFEKAKVEREERKRKLREERKAELEKHQNEVGLNSQNVTPVEAPSSESQTFSSNEKKVVSVYQNNFAARAKVAAVQTVVIVFLGLSVGTLGYFGIENSKDDQYGFWEGMALAVYTTFDFERETASSVSMKASALDSSRKILEDDVALSVHVGTTTHTSIILSETEVFTATTVESVEASIKQSFSDDVEVVLDEEKQDEVIVTPHFVDGEGESRRFKIEPVEDEEVNNSIQ